MWLSSSSLNIHYVRFYTINSDNFTRHFASCSFSQLKSETNHLKPREIWLARMRMWKITVSTALFFGVWPKKQEKSEKQLAKKELTKWTKRKMVAIDAYVPFLHIHSNTQTVEITAWSNRNLRNFLIFCISLGVLLGAYFSSDVQNSVLISLNRKSFQTLGQFVWHTRRETTWSACTMRITEQPNIRNRLIGALTEITLTMDLRISQLSFCSPRCACAWLSLSFSFYFYFPFLSSFLFFIAVCVYAFCACLLFK